MRAGVVPVGRLAEYRHSSFVFLERPKERPAALRFEGVLAAAGGLKDTPAGRRSYAEYLSWLAADAGAQKELAFETMSRGWALGSRDFKQALVKEHQEKLARVNGGEREAQEARELIWAQTVERWLKILGRGAEHARIERKGAD